MVAMLVVVVTVVTKWGDNSSLSIEPLTTRVRFFGGQNDDINSYFAVLLILAAFQNSNGNEHCKKALTTWTGK